MSFNELNHSKSHVKLAKRFSSVILMGPKMSDELVALIAHMFTEEEAKFARFLPPVLPMSYKKCARLSNTDPDKVKVILEGMNDKRVIFRLNDKYSLLPLIPGVFEYHLLQYR